MVIIQVNRQNFGEKIQKRREELGLTQRAVCYVGKIHATYLGDIESGKSKNPTMSIMGSLSRALDCKFLVEEEIN